MSDLVEFLLARIAEDEAVARAATVGPWEADVDRVQSPGVPVGMQARWQREDWTRVGDGLMTRDSRHIARHDPARVLAECEAKRRIVEGDHPKMDDADYRDGWVAGLYAEGVLQLLALPYADHPDYREEWKP